jgi:uncharacterized protein YjbI with pentapeptide repeats
MNAETDNRGKDLSFEDMKDRDLSGVDFSRARLVGTCFQGADLYRANFRGANLSRAEFCDRVGDPESITRSAARGLLPMSFAGANLEGAILPDKLLDFPGFDSEGPGRGWPRAVLGAAA